ncbi:MAG TPA: tetratricopeptide repeat protein [Gammaproteobacteria bacterium]
MIRVLLLFSCTLLSACGGPQPRPLPEPLQTAAAAEQRGIRAYAAGRYADAIRHFESAFNYYNRTDLRESMLRNRIYMAQSALVINNLSQAHIALADLAELIEYSGQYQDQRYHLWLLQSEYTLRLKQYPQALNLLEQILTAADQVNQDIVTAALINRTQIAIDMETADSQMWLDRAWAQTDSGTPQYQRLLRLKAQLLLAVDDFAGAEKLLHQALAGYRRVLFQPGIAATLGELGRARQAQNAFADARLLFKRALNIRLELADMRSAADLAAALESIETQAGNTTAAAIYADQQKKLESLITSRNSQL